MVRTRYQEQIRGAHSFTLWGDDVAALRLHLNDREAGRVPAAAESFHEQNAGDQALAVYDGRLLFVLQEILLSGDDVEVIDQAALVSTGGNVERSPCGINGLLLLLLRFAEDVERGQFILDFLIRAKNGLAIAGHVRVPARASKLNLSAARAAGEDVFGHIRADCPEDALNAGEFCDVGGLPSGLAE